LALDDLLTIPGEGVQGVYEGHHYFLGQKNPHEAIPAEEPFLKDGDSLVELYEDEGVLLGFFALSDTLKKEAKPSHRTSLKEMRLYACSLNRRPGRKRPKSCFGTRYPPGPFGFAADREERRDRRAIKKPATSA
jgi:hypothetical protein